MSLLDKFKNIFKDKWTEEDLEDNTRKLYQRMKREDYQPEVILDVSDNNYIGREMARLFNIPNINIKDTLTHKNFSQKKVLIVDERYNHQKYLKTGKLLMEDLRSYDFRMATLTLSEEDEMPDYFFTNRKIKLPYEK